MTDVLATPGERVLIRDGQGDWVPGLVWTGEQLVTSEHWLAADNGPWRGVLRKAVATLAIVGVLLAVMALASPPPVPRRGTLYDVPPAHATPLSWPQFGRPQQ